VPESRIDLLLPNFIHIQVRWINGGTMFYAYQDIYAHYESAKPKKDFDKTKEGEAFKLVDFPDKKE
jgi:hypothetical protein